ncbi:hypothetical protein [Arthrobacter sp. A2-55]|uniref:hypothetical protein n=1 Tax=Arthrobacter sp. A2-55 TaxID=2897337 RepID=UPI0021CDC6C5|nr:hypothetical protein [Arthrobacter sp. A2-55]MCU6481885.1 hypothetical protein [Arthrobacter sp. A2-55]
MDPLPAKAPLLKKSATGPMSPWWGVGITLVGWLILAIPAFFLLFATATMFSGCFLECTAPDPAGGTAGVVFLAAMVAGPPLLGTAVVTRRRLWWIALGACVLVVVAVFIVVASL